jgi:hypothetical protein
MQDVPGVIVRLRIAGSANHRQKVPSPRPQRLRGGVYGIDVVNGFIEYRRASFACGVVVLDESGGLVLGERAQDIRLSDLVQVNRALA